MGCTQHPSPGQPSRCRRAGPADPEPFSPLYPAPGRCLGARECCWIRQGRGTGVLSQPRGAAAELTPEHLPAVGTAAPQRSPTAGCPPARKHRENLPANRAAESHLNLAGLVFSSKYCFKYLLQRTWTEQCSFPLTI